MKFKNLCLFICSGFMFLQSCAFALSPSRTQDLTEKNKFYINSNGGISHNTYVIEKDGEKFFFKETKRKLSMYDTAKRAITEYFGKKYILKKLFIYIIYISQEFFVIYLRNFWNLKISKYDYLNL